MTLFTKTDKVLKSSKRSSLGWKDSSETSRTERCCCQKWRHLEERRLVATVDWVGRNERMWLSTPSGRLLILSSFSSCSSSGFRRLEVAGVVSRPAISKKRSGEWLKRFTPFTSSLIDVTLFFFLSFCFLFIIFCIIFIYLFVVEVFITTKNLF